MKKVLFATTALVASAGFAAAEVDITGSAEMGVVGGTGVETQFLQSVDVRFAMTGETDNGLSFGATIDLDDALDQANRSTFFTDVDIDDSTNISDFTVFIQGDFGTLTMGDTDGAFDWAMNEVLMAGGSINDAEEHGGYNGNGGLDGGNDGQVLRYDYSFGDFAFAASVELDDTGAALTGDIFGLGVTYSADLGAVALGLGLGYQDSDTNDVIGVSVDADFGNGFSLGLNYSDFDTTADHFGIGIGYTMDAWAIGLNYGEFDGGAEGFGLAVAYDLGGAEIQFGYGDTDTAGVSTNTWSLGVAMSF